MSYIARLNVTTSSDDQRARPEGVKDIAGWAQVRELDVVVWAALPSNFADKAKRPFSIQGAIEYLKGLSPPAKVKAAEYIWRAPEFVRTPLRRAMEQHPWFHERAGSS